MSRGTTARNSATVLPRPGSSAKGGPLPSRCTCSAGCPVDPSTPPIQRRPPTLAPVGVGGSSTGCVGSTDDPAALVADHLLRTPTVIDRGKSVVESRGLLAAHAHGYDTGVRR